MTQITRGDRSVTRFVLTIFLVLTTACTKGPRFSFVACAASLPAHITAQLQTRKLDNPFDVQLAVLRENRWPNGATLRIRFLGGSEGVHNRVIRDASTWTEVANIKFRRVLAEPSDVRVSDNAGDNFFWALHGTDAVNNPSQETVHLGFVDPENMDSDTFRGYVLHEFGHVLGAVHEHQSPESHIQWNKPVVYAYYTHLDPPWTTTMVDDNIFSLYSSAVTSATPFDPLSIMLYAFPPEFTTNGFSTHDNTVLSAMDRSLMQTMYPMR